MYTQQDRIQVRGKIIKNSVIAGVVTAALIALYVVGLIQRWKIGVMVIGAAIFAVLCFAWLLFIWPWVRYAFFLRDMETGLTRVLTGSIVEISEQEDYQDGVRVLPVRILLAEEQDERIVYLNATKTEHFPKQGDAVQLHCYGRHIKEIVYAK